MSLLLNIFFSEHFKLDNGKRIYDKKTSMIWNTEIMTEWSVRVILSLPKKTNVTCSPPSNLSILQKYFLVFDYKTLDKSIEDNCHTFVVLVFRKPFIGIQIFQSFLQPNSIKQPFRIFTSWLIMAKKNIYHSIFLDHFRNSKCLMFWITFQIIFKYLPNCRGETNCSETKETSDKRQATNNNTTLNDESKIATNGKISLAKYASKH